MTGSVSSQHASTKVPATTLILPEEVPIKMVRHRYGYPFFYAKCQYGRHYSRIHTARRFCTDEPTTDKWSAIRELGLMIEFGLQRAIQRRAPERQVRLDGLLFSGDAQARFEHSAAQPSRWISRQILRDLTSFLSNLAPGPGEHSLGVRAEK